MVIYITYTKEQIFIYVIIILGQSNANCNTQLDTIIDLIERLDMIHFHSFTLFIYLSSNTTYNETWLRPTFQKHQNSINKKYYWFYAITLYILILIIVTIFHK